MCVFVRVSTVRGTKTKRQRNLSKNNSDNKAERHELSIRGRVSPFPSLFSLVYVVMACCTHTDKRNRCTRTHTRKQLTSHKHCPHELQRRQRCLSRRRLAAAVIVKDAIKWATRRCHVCVRVFVTMRLNRAYVHRHTHTHIYSWRIF